MTDRLETLRRRAFAVLPKSAFISDYIEALEDRLAQWEPALNPLQEAGQALNVPVGMHVAEVAPLVVERMKALEAENTTLRAAARKVIDTANFDIDGNMRLILEDAEEGQRFTSALGDLSDVCRRTSGVLPERETT